MSDFVLRGKMIQPSVSFFKGFGKVCVQPSNTVDQFSLYSVSYLFHGDTGGLLSPSPLACANFTTWTV